MFATMTFMTNSKTTAANDILQAACSSRGFSVFESHKDIESDVAASLERRGLLAVSIAPVTIPGGPQLYGPDTDDRVEMRATYRATPEGRQKFVLGALLAW